MVSHLTRNEWIPLTGLNKHAMKFRKPDIRDIIIVIETFLLFFLLFHSWDMVKLFLAGIFT